MDNKKIKAVINGKKTDLLNVPYYSQNPVEYLCVIYSLMMVLDYYDEHFLLPNNIPIPDHSKEKLIKELNANTNSGTNLSKSIIEKLGTNYTQYQFFYRRSTLKEIENSLNSNFPVIVIYNPSIILINEFGPSHAGVVTGINDGEIILNNPWYGHGYYYNTQQFNDSWELEYCVSLYVRPNLQREIE